MPKLFSKISALLLAPVVFGSVCFTCLVQPLPALAAPAPVMMAEMQPNQACADYQDSEPTPTPTPTPTPSPKLVVAAVNHGVMTISGSEVASFARHDSNCRIAGDDAIVDAKISPLSQPQPVVAVLPPRLAESDLANWQKPILVFYKIKPDKTDFITGCVIKLE